MIHSINQTQTLRNWKDWLQSKFSPLLSKLVPQICATAEMHTLPSTLCCQSSFITPAEFWIASQPFRWTPLGEPVCQDRLMCRISDWSTPWSSAPTEGWVPSQTRQGGERASCFCDSVCVVSMGRTAAITSAQNFCNERSSENDNIADCILDTKGDFLFVFWIFFIWWLGCYC